MKLVTTEQMRAIESACEERGITTAQLMDAAGLAVAQEGWIALGVLMDRVVLLLCGPGNNGADTLVAARSLREWGADVRAYLIGDRPDDDTRLGAAVEAGATIVRQSDDSDLGTLRQWLAEAELVVDGILGTGQHLPLREDVVAVLQAFFRERVSAALAAGVERAGIVIDPGLGFGKTVEQNLLLIERTSELVSLGYPVMSGISRKSFTVRAGRLPGGDSTPPEERLAATVGLSVVHLNAGARLFRVHDVAAHKQSLTAAFSCISARSRA